MKSRTGEMQSGTENRGNGKKRSEKMGGNTCSERNNPGARDAVAVQFHIERAMERLANEPHDFLLREFGALVEPFLRDAEAVHHELPQLA